MVASLPELLRASADRAPQAGALRSRGRSRSYAELDRDADALAAALVELGVARGDRVAVASAKSPEVVAAMYAAMRAGAAYVPLDPAQPVARAATVVADAEPSCLVASASTADGLVGALREAGGAVPPGLLLLDDGEVPEGVSASIGLTDALSAGKEPPGRSPRRDDLAYLLYTSGSTGVPKGVALTHGNALAFVEWAAGAIGTGPGDRFSSHAPLHFDLSVFDLYVAAAGGASVVLVPEEEAYFGDALVRLIGDEAITVWYSVPTALQLIVRHLATPEGLRSLRAVVFAGEVYPTPRLRELREALPSTALWNLYGPTETNVVTAFRVDELGADDRPIPIGWACSGAEAFAVGEDGTVVSAGGTGELYVVGPSVMRGYWRRPEQTSSVLVADPRPGADAVAYRTGDLVTAEPDGSFRFVGRRDHQVKSRGYRIELGEVEAALHADPAVSEAVAVAVPHPEWGTTIVAFVVAADGATALPNEIRRRSSRRLPRYMVPSEVRLVPTLPRTSTGKVDRRALLDASGGGPDPTR